MSSASSWQTTCGGDISHTSAAHPQSTLSTSPHSTGFGSHTVNDPFCSLVTQISSSSSQYEQSGTTSHASAGTHCPVQHAASTSTDGTSVPGQSGGNDLQSTSTGLQFTLTNVQRPNRHCTSADASPFGSHVVTKHSGRSHGGGCSPGPIGSHEQQSLISVQSESCVHGTTSTEPVSPELPPDSPLSPSVVVPGPLDDPIAVVVPGSTDVDPVDAPLELPDPSSVDVPAAVSDPLVVGSPPVVGPAVIVAPVVVTAVVSSDPPPPHPADNSPRSANSTRLQCKKSMFDV